MNLFSEPYLTALINISIFLSVSFAALFYKYIYPKKNINFLLIILVVSILPALSIFREGVFSSGDMRTHLAHLINFYSNLQEGNLFPRWAGDLCGMKGCPVFQITYILPYYLGSFFHFIGFNFLTSIKLVYASAFVLSGFTMYLWARENFGNLGGLIGSIFYLFAPYHLIDLHFRGSVGEVLSFTIIPIVFLLVKRIVETDKSRYFFLLSLAIVLLLLSHSSIAIITVPTAFIYGFFVWTNGKRKRANLIILISSFIYAMLISAFYWVPAYQEVKYTWQSNTTYGYFMNFIDYIISPAKYGLLFQDSTAQIRPIIGYTQLIVFIFAIYLLIKDKIKKRFKPLLLFMITVSVILFVMMLRISDPIWKNIPILHSFIMVHRLLVLNSFIIATIAAIALIHLKNKRVLMIILYITIFSTILNWANRYMVPVPPNPIRNENEFFTQYYDYKNPDYELRRKTLVVKREKLAFEIPTAPLEFLSGSGSFIELKRKQNLHEYIISANRDLVIRENTHYFPGWKVFANSQEVDINFENSNKNSFGFITFNLPKGLYKIEVVYTETNIRKIFFALSSLVFLFGIFLFAFYFPVISYFKKIIGKYYKKS